jgi:hypothetical protein
MSAESTLDDIDRAVDSVLSMATAAIDIRRRLRMGDLTPEQAAAELAKSQAAWKAGADAWDAAG